MSVPNPFEGRPRHHMMFLNLRDGGGVLAQRATSVAAFYGVTLEKLKVHCRQAMAELIAERGHLEVYELPLQEWANT